MTPQRLELQKHLECDVLLACAATGSRSRPRDKDENIMLPRQRVRNDAATFLVERTDVPEHRGPEREKGCVWRLWRYASSFMPPRSPAGHEETFSGHFALEVRRGRWGYLKEFRFSGRCQSAGSSNLKEKLVGSWCAALSSETQGGKPKRNPAKTAKTGPQRRKHQDWRHSNSNQRAPTEHPKAFLSLLGSSIQR